MDSKAYIRHAENLECEAEKITNEIPLIVGLPLNSSTKIKLAASKREEIWKLLNKAKDYRTKAIMVATSHKSK